MKVKVVKIRAKYLVLRWIDPQTNRPKQKSAGTTDRRKADRMAGKLENELRAGRYFEPSRITWQEFRALFEAERYPVLAPGSRICYEATFNRLESSMHPIKLVEIDAREISQFQTKLKESGNSDATVCKHLRHLKASLRWAKSMDLLNRVPDFYMPKLGRNQSLMKGRPITDEEFQRMLNAVESVVGEEASDSWRFLLQGLWHSGLRLGEALLLTWHRSDSIFVNLSGEYPMFQISARCDKGRRDRLLVMVPEFANLVRNRMRNRSGFVFEPMGKYPGTVCRNRNWVSKIGSRIGRNANIIVSSGTKPKFASIHDLRRSFGYRWAQRVMPNELMELMRHDSIVTTLRYYVGRDVQRSSRHIWQLFGGGANDAEAKGCKSEFVNGQTKYSERLVSFLEYSKEADSNPHC